MLISLYAQAYLDAISTLLLDLGIDLILDEGSGKHYFYQKDLDPASSSISSAFASCTPSSGDGYETQDGSHERSWVGLLWNQGAITPTVRTQQTRPRRGMTHIGEDDQVHRMARMCVMDIGCKLVTNDLDVLNTLYSWFLTEGMVIDKLSSTLTLDGEDLGFKQDIVHESPTPIEDIFPDFKGVLHGLEWTSKHEGIIYSPRDFLVKRVKTIMMGIYVREQQQGNYKLVVDLTQIIPPSP